MNNEYPSPFTVPRARQNVGGYIYKIFKGTEVTLKAGEEFIKIYFSISSMVQN